MLARRGWRIALLARDASALEATRQEIEDLGGTALAISTDTSDASGVFSASDQIIEAWGEIDIWINNAMVTIYAPVAETTPEEFARVTAVTYLGYVHGTLAALKHMRLRNAGTIVQVGSALSYRAIPLQSAYCAAKFAIRGFTDALRSELARENSHVRITMVQLPAVNTPQFEWARNRMPQRVQPVPPIYQPEAVAETIVQAAQIAPREFWVGIASVKAIIGTIVLPGTLDRFLARRAWDGELTGEPESRRPDNLFEPVPGVHRTRGRFGTGARKSVPIFNPRNLRAAGALMGAAGLISLLALIALVLALL